MIKINNTPIKSLLIATQNQGKVREIRSLLEESGLHLNLITPAQIALNLDVLEDGLTYQENAARKAVAFCQASGLVSLADDSGLEVDALDGRPGLHSARYSPPVGGEPWDTPPVGGDARRRSWLLHNLHDYPRPWTASFHCTVALASPDGWVRFAEGCCPGEIIPEERGAGGFGYDPIFLLTELGLTMAELSMEQKNHLSHRARAVRAAVPLLRRWVDETEDGSRGSGS
jgi:XTP/dITP diphosphohydrolase